MNDPKLQKWIQAETRRLCKMCKSEDKKLEALCGQIANDFFSRAPKYRTKEMLKLTIMEGIPRVGLKL